MKMMYRILYCTLIIGRCALCAAKANRGVHVLQEAAAASAPEDPALLRAQVS